MIRGGERVGGWGDRLTAGQLEGQTGNQKEDRDEE